jgi:hypothetical protein
LSIETVVGPGHPDSTVPSTLEPLTTGSVGYTRGTSLERDCLTVGGRVIDGDTLGSVGFPGELLAVEGLLRGTSGGGTAGRDRGGTGGSGAAVVPDIPDCPSALGNLRIEGIAYLGWCCQECIGMSEVRCLPRRDTDYHR